MECTLFCDNLHRKQGMFFGDIVNGQMQLSEIGEIADRFWLQIPEHFPFVKLDAHVIMPNHMHGIIVIDKPDDKRNMTETLKLNVSTPTPNSPQKSRKHSQTAAASQKWKPASLGVIINQYKRICTINARKINVDFAWQSRFHDYIIRDYGSYQRIRKYIINNPENWKDDTLKNQ